ncbi:MAG: CYTH domain-containing protein [Limnoraphis robusta]|uniref:Adenylate cyclase n=2 Tax=Limnoraphis robusta TaxID=1118279 RepID=A0A0F5YM10_9CYAN|nr:CYTH domain-containing protein [Limnoraphis robusta]KKD39210.1 adenylate cyclase [Limnoraphis robusta CS-951]MEA5496370.1 CYTH domain-containing protein [Limnoraphis robusta BA-68 BA1]MEA5520111.1 CYTH domain-containing protein [Limnoraphis robusta CCNP1315]MEA5538248.1 CYTH domain-containing protein [Limnoraphis robusta Tam1]MEA5546807.1 CYTH domain-containing protein [Limnoraphis robusta CCNP1324]
MGIEIERKFLVKDDRWRSLATGILYCQGYISSENGRTVRVRIIGNQGYLTIKGAGTSLVRSEFEYVIPVEDAEEMLQTLCDRPFIEKKRHKISFGNLIWEVDEFLGDNQGLIIAEVELSDPNQIIEIPDWISEEVSHDPRYYNSNLVKNPYRQWEETKNEV